LIWLKKWLTSVAEPKADYDAHSGFSSSATHQEEYPRTHPDAIENQDKIEAFLRRRDPLGHEAGDHIIKALQELKEEKSKTG